MITTTTTTLKIIAPKNDKTGITNQKNNTKLSCKAVVINFFEEDSCVDRLPDLTNSNSDQSESGNKN